MPRICLEISQSQWLAVPKWFISLLKWPVDWYSRYMACCFWGLDDYFSIISSYQSYSAIYTSQLFVIHHKVKALLFPTTFPYKESRLRSSNIEKSIANKLKLLLSIYTIPSNTFKFIILVT